MTSFPQDPNSPADPDKPDWKSRFKHGWQKTKGKLGLADDKTDGEAAATDNSPPAGAQLAEPPARPAPDTPPAAVTTDVAPSIAATEGAEPALTAATTADEAERNWKDKLKAGWSKTVEVLNTDVTELFGFAEVDADGNPLPPEQTWGYKLKAGLAKTRDKLGKSLASLFGGGKIDEDLYEELESVLLTADMGVAATQHLLDDVRNRVSLAGLKDASELKSALHGALSDLITPLQQPLNTSGKKPFVIMVAGVNGAGKTTSIGKLAKFFQKQGKSVLLAAGDTFRAAAREQLQAWGQRNGVAVITQEGGDSAAVIYDAIQAATARGIDIVLADTAGRLPTQLHLMEEIKKVKRVIQKIAPDGPHEVLLVLDANIGQNALNQVKVFDEALGLTGLVLTKLDGTAKGGIIAAIAREKPVPLRFIGIGEGIDDLRPFSASDYVDALFD